LTMRHHTSDVWFASLKPFLNLKLNLFQKRISSISRNST